jgi:hypothetical protein
LIAIFGIEENDMGEALKHAPPEPNSTGIEEALAKTLCAPDYGKNGVTLTAALLAEAFCLHATLAERTVVMKHLVQTSALSPQVGKLLMDIASRAGNKARLLKELHARPDTATNHVADAGPAL